MSAIVWAFIHGDQDMTSFLLNEGADGSQIYITNQANIQINESIDSHSSDYERSNKTFSNDEISQLCEPLTDCLVLAL